MGFHPEGVDKETTAGGGIVEGYPEPAGAVPAGFLYNGAQPPMCNWGSRAIG